jgi:HEAT repeat protein
MRIFYTLTCFIFTALLTFAQQPPEPPIPLAPLAPLPPMAPLPPDFAELPLLAFQDSQRDNDRNARREQEQLRRLQDSSSESYSRGKSYLDRKEYDRAIDAFSRVIDNKASRADGAYYWRAYAQNKLGHRDEALASLGELQKNYPTSRWLDDAKALQVEIRSQSGQPVSPETATDEDLKLLALNSLMNTDPERSIPMLEKLLKSSNSPKLKERALFVLAQSHSQTSRDLLAGIAKGGSNPDLQSKAIEYLGISGGHDNLQVLVDIYKSSNDAQVKRTILNSFMVAGSRDNLLAVAKSESNTELKVHAIQLLGNTDGSADLTQLYSAESAPEVKRAVIQGLFISGNADKLFEIVKNEKDESLRRFAINQLGVMGKSKTGAALTSMYAQETSPENKKAIINGLFVQGNATALVEIARKETDLNLKKAIVNQLSVMHSKEATDYLLEILNK